ncbi:MAG: family 10 glycosylhydrolase [Paeniclostridium sordellii]|nr:family 10 glycosylhydrolase [Paeniclostridium hominis]MDU2592571.1 family 10 glycosylhydrolase [Paeniclostridium sordellii]
MKIIKFLTTLFIFVFLIFNIKSFASNYEMRGAWITTVYNTDWPSEKNYGDVNHQKKEFISILDKLKANGFNTVVVQVRPKGDALYKSNINPWSDVLTGVQGKNPGYDPLEFMISEAHKRGMKLHAWFNPYRITTKGTDLTKLSSNHPARKNPSWVIYYNGAMYYNPELEEVQKHICNTVAEVVKNYSVDGIHFDDYFYPQGYPLPEGQGKDGYVANQRRKNVNNMIKSVRSTIKSINKNVEFGVSPSGIWKNKSSDKTGSNTNGNESYYSVYADTRAWIENEWIDYVVPQLYWTIGQSGSDYRTLVSWWSDEVKNSNVDLYIGQGVYKDKVANEIDKQINLNRCHNNIYGSIYFTTNDIVSNDILKSSIKKLYEPMWMKRDNQWYYLNVNGYSEPGWKYIGETWYYFNNAGVMKTGWIQLGDKWYYLRPNGAMAVGWEQVGGTWYYLDNSGSMKTGWIQLGDKWYYLRPNGAMAIGWEQVGGTWYYLDSSGSMKTGWIQLGDKWYYLRSNGAMAVGWEQVGETWYYLDNSGSMKTGWIQLGDKWYYLRSNGAMAVGWELIEGNWYYFHNSGNMGVNIVVDGWKIDTNGVATKIN